MSRPRWRKGVDVAAAGFLPGALFGGQLAGLIFFLNPELPFGILPVVRGVGFYGGLWGALTLALQLPFLWNRPERARRWLPWGLTVALAAAAVLDGVHASIYAYFLPPGINVRLVKAALWLGLGAVIAFYTALLHSLHDRPYGLRSRIGFLILVLGSVYVMVERREAFQPPPRSSPLPSAVESLERPLLYVVGLDGATLDAILPLAEEGRLPFFSRMLNEGAYGRLESLTPLRHKALWTSLATGKYPYEHRAFGGPSYAMEVLAPQARIQLLPLGLAFERWGVGPVVEPLEPNPTLRAWDVLARLGVPTGMVGWPAAASPDGDPADGGLGGRPLFRVSESFFTDAARGRTIPTDLTTRAALFRPDPAEIDPSLANRFHIPGQADVLSDLADDLWRESLTRVLLDQYQAVEAVFVHLPGLGPVSRRLYGGYWEYQFEGARHQDYQRAAEAVAAYYAHLDRFLTELWERRRRPGILAVVSAYGTQEAVGLRRAVNQLAGGRPLEGYRDGSPDGVLLLFGQGIEPGVLLDDARLVDVAPTLIYGLGLPVARDLDGQILMSAFRKGFLARHPLTFLPSYETLTE